VRGQERQHKPTHQTPHSRIFAKAFLSQHSGSYTQFRRPGPGKQNVFRPSQLSPPFFKTTTLSAHPECDKEMKEPQVHHSSANHLPHPFKINKKKKLNVAENKENTVKKIFKQKKQVNQVGESETSREKVSTTPHYVSASKSFQKLIPMV
jgi:hypothetical protein